MKGSRAPRQIQIQCWSSKGMTYGLEGSFVARILSRKKPPQSSFPSETMIIGSHAQEVSPRARTGCGRRRRCQVAGRTPDRGSHGRGDTIVVSEDHCTITFAGR